jgi:hypothetical protein
MPTKSHHQILNPSMPMTHVLLFPIQNWRMGINPTKTWCLNFFNKKANDNQLRLWLMGKLINYCQLGKCLGVTPRFLADL